MRCNALLTQDAAFAVLSIKKLFCPACERNRCWCERLLYSKMRKLSRGAGWSTTCRIVVFQFPVAGEKDTANWKLTTLVIFWEGYAGLINNTCLCIYCARAARYLEISLILVNRLSIFCAFTTRGYTYNTV